VRSVLYLSRRNAEQGRAAQPGIVEPAAILGRRLIDWVNGLECGPSPVSPCISQNSTILAGHDGLLVAATRALKAPETISTSPVSP